MYLISRSQSESVMCWFSADQAGPQVGLHYVNTGIGRCWADRWPEPWAVVAEVAGNYSLAGDPDTLNTAELQATLAGFVEAEPQFRPLLLTLFPDLKIWPRVLLALDEGISAVPPTPYPVRRLTASDERGLAAVDDEMDWIYKTWGGPGGLGSSGHGWAAFDGSKIISIACTFFNGDKYEDIGVATDPDYRGLGLSVACSAALCREIQARGKRPSWSTSADNIASLRVAEKLGFRVDREDVMYVVGIEIPEPAKKEE